MSLRVIAGDHKGRILATSDSFKTHPMGDRIRSSLFNILGSLEGQIVLDAFAGSGSLGLEALSRGAAYVTFVERDRAAQRVIEQNIRTLNVKDTSHLIKSSVSAWLHSSKAPQADHSGSSHVQEARYDLIFADPPYNDLQLSTVFALKSLLKPNGLMVLSYPGRESTPTVNGVVVVDKRSYGDAALAFYRLEDVSV